MTFNQVGDGLYLFFPSYFAYFFGAIVAFLDIRCILSVFCLVSAVYTLSVFVEWKLKEYGMSTRFDWINPATAVDYGHIMEC